ncbi:hypothetical protein O181_099058 [Austropuccinia psidii MF-1]|uniref:Retrotransposon gag domain-containing protein n=1 Tax=Austropuccinia psidii MF-1 TaxID=1389203 RepID=A0A9Q3JAD9_9BASI|nr:hypothetical protein [Austropuccinia psidii MF-1]
MEGAAPSRRSRSFSRLLGGYPSISEGARARLGEVEDEDVEESGETEVADALENAPEVPQASNLALSSQPLVSQTEPSLLKMMEQMTQFMGQLTQAVTPRDNSKAPAFKTPYMKATNSFDANLFSDRKKVLDTTSFLTGRARKWIEPYLSNISNEDPSYLLNNWPLFESQLLNLFDDHNEVRKAEQELENSRMNEIRHVSLYISDFSSLTSRIGDCGKELISMFKEEDWNQDY